MSYNNIWDMTPFFTFPALHFILGRSEGGVIVHTKANTFNACTMSFMI